MGYIETLAEEVFEYNSGLPSEKNTPYHNKLNYIVTQWATLCNGSLTLYVETLLPAATRAFISFFDFDDGDVIRWIYRPRGLTKRGRHGKAGILNRLARPIGMKELENRHTTFGQKELWRLDGLGQRVFFWWMVVGVATDFVYDWSSLLQKSGGCQQGSGVADHPGGTLITLGAFQAVGYSIIRSSILPVDMQPFGAACGGNEVQAVASLSMNGKGTPPATLVTIRLVFATPGGVQTFEDATSITPNGAGSVMVSATVKGVTFVGIDVKTNGSAVEISDGSFFVTVFDQWNK